MRRPGRVAAILVAGTIAAVVPLAAPAAGDPPEIAADEYAARRARVAEAIGDDSLLVLLPAPTAHRNGDVDWPFRQDDNLYWLTGIAQEGTALTMAPGEDDHREVLFARDRNPAAEVWDGRRLDRDELRAISGVEELASTGELRWFVEAALAGDPWQDGEIYRYYRTPGLPKLLAARNAGRATVWLDLEDRGEPARVGQPTRVTPEQRLAAEIRERFPEIAIRDVSPVLSALREVKSPAEQALLRRAIEITEEAIGAGMKRTLDADWEYQVEAAIEHVFRDRGACCWGYPSIVASGTNATILHYNTNNDPVDRHGLMLFDVGADYRGYTADISRTFPADGTFSDPQREVYEAVLGAWEDTLVTMVPGKLPVDSYDAAVASLARRLHRLGLASEPTAEQARLYFIHGLGHPIGLQVHDVFDRTRAFEPGMVVTLEPGVYVRRTDVEASAVFQGLDGEAKAGIRRALDRYDGIGVRIEDDVLITDGEPEVMSDGLARTVEEIEAWLASHLPHDADN